MTSDARGQQLHDLATRVASLSGDEQAELIDWYRRLDQEERESLFSAIEPGGSLAMRAKLDTSLAELQTVVARIRQVEAENQSLKGEILVLQERLGVPKTMQPA